MKTETEHELRDVTRHRATRLLIILGGFFIANALIAEFIGIKIFSLEETLGFHPANIPVFGFDLSFNLTAGVLLWPVVFVMTDIINEYYGIRGVRLLSFLAAGLIAYAYLMVYLGIRLTPAQIAAFIVAPVARPSSTTMAVRPAGLMRDRSPR